MDIQEAFVPALMPAPSPHFAAEEARLRVLAEFQAEALEDDPELQAIVNFAARLCGVPSSMVTLLDDRRQYFLARTGVDQRETPREVSFCTHALGQTELLEVADATQDPRFADNPLVTGAPGVRFYAGQPLVSDEGAPLGTLCVIDLEPHRAPLNEFQREGMAVLAQAAMRRLRGQRKELAATREIARSEARLRALADSMPDIAFSADESGQIDYFNRRWHEFTGIDMGDTDRVSVEVVHPDDHAKVWAKWRHALDSGEPYEDEHRLRRADGTYRWCLARALPVETGGGTRWFGTITDIDDAHRLSEARDTLAKELSHRIKNIFAVVSGLVSLEARKSPEHKAFAERIGETLRALGRAHEFVRPASGETQESLTGLLGVLFEPYLATDGCSRVTVSGTDQQVSTKAATPLALVFHELATNSAKYGALSVDGGTVSLDVSEEDGRVHLHWKESGGPATLAGGGENAPKGFGSRLVDLAVTGQLQGRWERRFEPDGLAVELDLPVTALSA
jgi:PAS domain S-box-containing protein